jgi:septal ring-binding cell division protein DamX
VISFPYSVESFDHVLQIIAQKLHPDVSTEDNTAGNGHLLTEISRTLREQGKQLLILFDEADKLYLATLERLRKMIDLVNEDRVLLQIILFGRKGLQAHIEQLALCTFKPTGERHLTLPPLTEEATFQYLNFCIRERPDFEGKDIFSREVAAKILALSHGDFRKINCLAADSLRSSADHADNTSFMVLLEHVRDADALPVKATLMDRLPLLFMQKKTAFGIGALLLILFLLVLTNKETEGPVPSSTTDRPLLATLAAIEPDKAEQEDTTDVPPAPVVVAEAPAEAVETVPADSVPAAAPVTEPAQPDPVATETPGAESVSVTITPLVEINPPEIQVVTADKFARKNSLPLLIGPEPYIKNKNLLKLKKTLKPTGTQTLPPKSLAAGNSWLAGKNNNFFTLQLMVLTGEQAVEKLGGIISDEEDRRRSENFIVLRKSTSPATFLLFYGEYPTLAAAREARDNLPPALQKYTPYPVSIKQAVEKSKT